MPIFSYVAVVSDNDGSAFITKAEFDSLKNNFQAQIDNYNQSIDSKIDGAIAAYLAGIKIETGDDHLEVDWIADMGTTTLGILTCKCVDILQEKINKSAGTKGSILPFTHVAETAVLGLRGIWLVSTDIGVYPLDTNRRLITPIELDYENCQYIFQPQFEVTNTYYAKLIRRISDYSYAVQRSNGASDSAWVDIQPYIRGVECMTTYNGERYPLVIGNTYSILDEQWSDKAGFPVYAYKVGDHVMSNIDQSVLGYPLIIASSGQGEIKFMYNTRDDHPFKAGYGVYSTQGGYNSGVKGDTAIIYFAITDLTTGTIEQYLTPQDGNIIRDYINQEDGVWKIVTGNMRANQALMLYMRSDIIGDSYAEKLYAFRIKMNFQNLNP